MATEFKGARTLSRKAYNELEKAYKAKYTDEEVNDILNILKGTLLYDPSISTYTKERGQQMIAKRKEKSKETGLSFYVLCGHDKLYAKKKNMGFAPCGPAEHNL